MRILNLLARPLLASIFVAGGLKSLRAPQSVAPKASNLVDDLGLGGKVDPALLVRINGAAQVASGVALATGIAPRLGATVLAGSLVPTTLAGHAFWNETDPAARASQITQCYKNASIMGGLLLVR